MGISKSTTIYLKCDCKECRESGNPLRWTEEAETESKAMDKAFNSGWLFISKGPCNIGGTNWVGCIHPFHFFRDAEQEVKEK